MRLQMLRNSNMSLYDVQKKHNIAYFLFSSLAYLVIVMSAKLRRWI